MKKMNWLLPALPKILSYFLVGALAVAITLTVVAGNESKLDELEKLINDKFIGEVDLTELEDAAAEAMLSATGDRWSYYIPADQYGAYQEQKDNAYVGVGISIKEREDGAGLDIVEVTAGGSAEEAGLLAGDVITAVDGKSIAGMDVNDIRNMIRGDVGTKVNITVLRGAEEITSSVTRKKIKTPVATARLLSGNIGLITIENFNSGCSRQTIEAVDSLIAQGAEKLIFDVRNNGGGYASELVKVLDYLLPEGDLFRTVDYKGKEEASKSDSHCITLPMAVLVNGNSYSAAEFFAAALMEYEAAKIVGQQTTGKGYFQVTYKLSDGSAVALSVGKYFTPKGVSLAGVGVTPDVVVPVDAETAAKIRAGTMKPMQDPQILAAIAALNA